MNNVFIILQFEETNITLKQRHILVLFERNIWKFGAYLHVKYIDVIFKIPF